ncbi:oncoprotein-induced transcript 3 protein-like [Ostrea edulis]|uniref:oncoprotein-induced transcript 3 protein-like n=1 Tax=Ostrea edulis TaxID=37623 RepID=UPI002094D658|nr:oncoprotein-induced transcript 3 protein-like [Ostrea edulis]
MNIGVDWSVYMLILLLTDYNDVDALDPCLSGNHDNLYSMEKRGPSYVMDSSPLCDRYITQGWYGTKGYLMSTSLPQLTNCGTLYPIWLNGEIPSAGQSAVLTACEVGFSSSCTKSYSIEVKNCVDIVVYKLRPADACNAAYCFGMCLVYMR